MTLFYNLYYRGRFIAEARVNNFEEYRKLLKQK